MQVQQRIHRIFRDILNLPIPSFDTDLIDEGILDSLVFVDLVMAMEKEFEISIDITELDLDHFRSVSRIAESVRNAMPSTATTEQRREGGST